MLLIHRVTCPYMERGCKWQFRSSMERQAQLQRELHALTCPRREGFALGLDDSGNQMLLCRYRNQGCERYWKFDFWGREKATADRKAHELACSRRPYTLR